MILLAATANISLSEVRVRTYIVLSGLLLTVAYGEYVAIRLAGIDPDWSVMKALTFCSHREWVHLNTAPLHTLARLCGALLGLGLGLYARAKLDIDQYYVTQQHKRSYRHPTDMRIMSAMLAVCVYSYAESINLTHDPIELFYVLAFIKHTIVPIIVVAAVPPVVNQLHSLLHSYCILKR